MKHPKRGDVAKTQIDANLRRIFEEDAEQALPSNLTDLLTKLDEVEVPAALAGGKQKLDPEQDA